MRNPLHIALAWVDRSLAGACLAVRGERPGLLTFLFHSLWRSRSEAGTDLVNPQQNTTVEEFRRFIAYYQRIGYRFVSPRDVLAGLNADGRHAMITFDDGYASNLLALDVLREFDVPATFYISAEHVRDGRCFMTDVCWRELRRRGLSARRIRVERHRLLDMSPDEQDAELIRLFGADALRPRGDVDRPMTPAELRALAADPRVHLGNHTLSHASLTRCPATELRRQIGQAQEEIRTLSGGVACESIAYPYGHVNAEVIRASREAGLRLGLTIDPRKNHLPIDLSGDGCMALCRFTLWGGRNIESQCRMFRSDMLIYPRLRACARWLGRGEISARYHEPSYGRV